MIVTLGYKRTRVLGLLTFWPKWKLKAATKILRRPKLVIIRPRSFRMTTINILIDLECFLNITMCIVFVDII